MESGDSEREYGSRRSRSSDTFTQELQGEEFDAIRFASYRTANKIRFIQKRANCKYNKIYED